MEKSCSHIRKSVKKLFKIPLIIYKITSDEALIYCLKIIQFLLELNFIDKIFVEDVNLICAGLVEKRKELNCLKETKKEDIKKICEFNLHENKPDLCIIIGGDGTILWANHVFQSELRPPFLAFNLGTLGYMATHYAEFFKDILENVFNPSAPIYYETVTLLKGKFSKMMKQSKEKELSKQNLNSQLKRSSSLKNYSGSCSKNSNFNSHSHVNNNNPRFSSANKIEHFEYKIENADKCEENVIYALNDITIERKDFSHMINTEIYYNNEPLTIIKSNGIIISSSMGSTAYSLSAGGTIMHYGLDCLILNSIAPHSLSFRPIAFPKGDKLKICLTEDSKDAIVINDGINKIHISHCQAIEVEISDKSVEFVLTQKCFENKSAIWKQKIINQLGWNNAFKNVKCSVSEEKKNPNSK